MLVLGIAMGWRVSSLLASICSWLAMPAMAADRPIPTSVPTTRLAAPVTITAPLPFRPAATAVAAFPDVVSERPTPRTDAALELLATNPYEAQLMAHKIAMNLYGEDPALEDPYADDRRLANPYTDD